MVGIVDKQMQQDTAAPAQNGPPDEKEPPVKAGIPEKENPKEQEGFKTTIMNKLPEQLKPAFERVVMAGQRILYSKDMQPEVRQYLDNKQKPMSQNLAEGAVALIGLIQSQAKNLPPQVLVPAGIELIHDAADFLQGAGKPVTPEDVSDATAYFVVLMLKQAGGSDQQVQQVMQQNAGQPPAQPPQGAEGATNGIQSQ